ncbi:MAG TPA: OmpA family protein, partial [Cyclobacteriaceae bacterium]|nr:OmpA family protein [Cyclobacteriaceae bacterium]
VMSNACIIDIYFAHDSDEPLSVSGVQGLLKSMLTNPNQRIEVRGYTDNNGHPDYNRELSLRRANSVKNYLVKSGIEESRIQTAGFGQENPIADNSTYEGRRLNRRVEFAIILE